MNQRKVYPEWIAPQMKELLSILHDILVPPKPKMKPKLQTIDYSHINFQSFLNEHLETTEHVISQEQVQPIQCTQKYNPSVFDQHLQP